MRVKALRFLVGTLVLLIAMAQPRALWACPT